MALITTEPALLRLLHLGSPSLPVGAYAFSQGLEAALDLQWLDNADDVEDWLRLQLQEGLACVDLPLLLRLYASLQADDGAALCYWNAMLLACRETDELRLGETATGAALARLLPAFGIAVPALDTPTFAALFAAAAVHWQLPPQGCALAYAWSWLDNQVLAATKLLPLGQTRAQQTLDRLLGEIPAALKRAGEIGDEDIGSSLCGLALASMHHEHQYSRLFRS